MSKPLEYDFLHFYTNISCTPRVNVPKRLRINCIYFTLMLLSAYHASLALINCVGISTVALGMAYRAFWPSSHSILTISFTLSSFYINGVIATSAKYTTKLLQYFIIYNYPSTSSGFFPVPWGLNKSWSFLQGLGGRIWVDRFWNLSFNSIKNKIVMASSTKRKSWIIW